MESTRPPALARLLASLERLPGVGARTARRLAEHLLRVPGEEALELAGSIVDARRALAPCSLCRAPAERDPCPRCADPRRRSTRLMVVESLRDLEAVEATGRYDGVYWILGAGPRLGSSAGDGVGADRLGLALLRERAESGGIEEVVLGTNPDFDGDGTARAAATALLGLSVRVTRLARGLPTGGQIEHQNAAAIADALAGRRPLDEDEPE